MLVLLIAYGGYFMLTKKSEPEITEVPRVSSKEIKSYFPMESEATFVVPISPRRRNG